MALLRNREVNYAHLYLVLREIVRVGEFCRHEQSEVIVRYCLVTEFQQRTAIRSLICLF